MNIITRTGYKNTGTSEVCRTGSLETDILIFNNQFIVYAPNSRGIPGNLFCFIFGVK